MADLDLDALENELQQLREKRAEARGRLDSMRAGRGRGRGPPGSGPRGRGEPQRAGVFSRLGGAAGARDGPWERDAPRGDRDRDAPGPAGRPSVFERLYDRSGSRGELVRGDRDTDRLEHRSPPHRSSSLAAARNDPPTSSSGRQPITSRLGSRVVVPDQNGEQSLPRTSSNLEEGEQPAAAAGAQGSRKRLLSAVVVNGEARTVSTNLDDDAAAAAAAANGADPTELERPVKRPALQADDKTKKRVKRMFGALLVGTLQKFKEEESAFKASNTAQRRQELERRAVERMEAEDAKRREQEAAARREEREAQISALLDLNLKADTKVLEILYAKRIQRKQKLMGFCVTKTQPPLYWSPREHCEDTQALLHQHATDFEDWKQQQLVQLEQEKAELAQRAAAKRELAAARAAAGGEDQQQQGHEQRGDREGGVEDGEELGHGGDEDENEAGEVGHAAGDGDGDGVGDRAAAIDEEEEQQEQEHMEEDAAVADDEQQAEEQEDQQQQAEAADVDEQPRKRSRRRQRGSDDEEEERLLSSEEEEEDY